MTPVEFTRPFREEQRDADPIDVVCGHHHPVGEPCWATEDGEICVHAPRCRFCGGGMEIRDGHEVGVHKECLVHEALGLRHTRGRR